MDFAKAAILSILLRYSDKIVHNSVFTASGASFFCQSAPRRRPSLPRDAADFRFLIELPVEDGVSPWEAEVLVAMREGSIWNPAVHLKIAAVCAPDTEDVMTITGRMDEWARSL